MSGPDRDSYTGQEYPPARVSAIPNIWEGRSPFYHTAELRRISQQYMVSAVALTQHPAPPEWLVRRRDCPDNFFPVVASLTQAVAAMDWCVRNDASVSIAIYWLNRKEAEPYLELLERFLKEAANV